MNWIGLLIALFVLGMAVGMAAFVNWGAKNYADWTDRKRCLVCGGFVVAGFVSAVLIFFSDSELRRTTLFEIDESWDHDGPFTIQFEVENPNVEHRIHVDPKLKILRSAKRPITLRVEAIEVGSGQQLLGEDYLFEVRERSGGARPTDRGPSYWKPVTIPFRPPRHGLIELRVSAVDGKPGRLHLLVRDPEKTDGKRASGY